MLNAPQAPKRPYEITRHGDTRVDPYYWLMNREDPEVLEHLRAENAFADQALSGQRELRETLFAEFKNRIEETDISVPIRRGAYWVYDRTLEDLEYPIICRLPVTSSDPTPPVIDPRNPPAEEQIVLDENVEASGHDFLSVGVLSVSPDDAWVAVGVDHDGDELHRVTFRPLNGQVGVDDELVDVGYGLTWAPDSRHCFYTRVDHTLRPFQIWRHELGTASEHDELVWEETDPEFTVSVGRSLDKQMLFLAISASMTTEIRYLSAHNPTGNFTVFEARQHGIEYDLDHFSRPDGSAWWIKVTNEDAKDFRALARPVSGGQWREIVAQRPGCRLDGVEAFEKFVVLVERFEGRPSVRYVRVLDGDDPFGDDFFERAVMVDPRHSPAAVYLSANAEYDSNLLRIQVTSMVTPRYVADLVVATGEELRRKQQTVKGGYDERDYVTARIWVPASDGVSIPATVVARRGVINVAADGSVDVPAPAPTVLYGYGSYEHSTDPYFSAMRLSLLERGVIYVIAHVRGGGEMGRAWYEMGRLEQKPTTFSDFVRVAGFLVDAGWTTPAQLAARGGSAGGLLMGAVMNLAPELFAAIVADVPFVDALTTMLDASLPLTTGEWEEWGNPDASEVTYRIMKAYSPYDNVSATNPDGTVRTYPHLLACGGLNDSRVGFWEPAKWVQKLRDANENNLALLRTEMGSGHGGPSGRYDSWRDEALIVAFLLSEIGADRS
jgi:oligopeptidase B